MIGHRGSDTGGEEEGEQGRRQRKGRGDKTKNWNL